MNAMLLRQTIWMPLAVTVVGLITAYWGTIDGMMAQWLNNDDFSHGLLIVPISTYLVWQRRERIARTPLSTDWRAVPFMAMAIGVHIVGELGAELFTTRISMIFFFIGAIWLLYGWPLTRVLAFPLGFLFLMLPLPGFIYSNITFPLQLLSSKWSVSFLHLFGVLAFREGNIIDLGFTQFQVVEACNGLRFILPLFTLGVLFAFWQAKPLWQRLALMAATVPIAISANILRIGGTGLIAQHWGSEAAEGFFHGFSGWAVFMLAFALFFGFDRLLALLPGRRRPAPTLPATEAGAGSDPAPAPVQRHRPLAAVMVLVGLLLATPLMVHNLGSVSPRPLKQPLSQFPLHLEGRVGRSDSMDPLIWERVGGQDYFMANYHQAGEVPINFYVAYYEHQRKAGAFIHSPRLCLPGAGWFIDAGRNRRLTPSAAGHRAEGLKINEMLIRKGSDTQLVYFWYQGRDRNFTSEFSSKFYMVWDGITRRRTDGALVRVIAPLSSDREIDATRRLMDAFALTAAGRLEGYLP